VHAQKLAIGESVGGPLYFAAMLEEKKQSRLPLFELNPKDVPNLREKWIPRLC
jgi:hypothetical protein